jgi:hypothetical protein
MTRRSGVSRRAWAKEDPEQSRIAEGGRFIMEVYPALALVTFNHTFFGRLKGPKYNPANKRKFRLEDWIAVVETVRRYAQHAGIVAIKEWANEILRIASPRKRDQDRLDAVICALVGYQWRTGPRDKSHRCTELFRYKGTAKEGCHEAWCPVHLRRSRAPVKRGTPYCVSGICGGFKFPLSTPSRTSASNLLMSHNDPVADVCYCLRGSAHRISVRFPGCLLAIP